jgi:palmitoyltransferase
MLPLHPRNVVYAVDHHCPWMGAKCIVRRSRTMTTSPRLTAAVQGFRTYPSFLHFLASVTLLAAYVAVVCIRGLVFAFSKPHAIVRIQHRIAENISRTLPFRPRTK